MWRELKAYKTITLIQKPFLDILHFPHELIFRVQRACHVKSVRQSFRKLPRCSIWYRPDLKRSTDTITQSQWHAKNDPRQFTQTNGFHSRWTGSRYNIYCFACCARSHTYFYFKFLQRTVYFGGNIWRKPILNSLSADEVDNLTARLQSVGLSSSVSL